MLKFLLKTGTLLAATALAIGAAGATQKIDPRARASAAETGWARVIIVTRANSAIKDGGNAFARPATYMSARLGSDAKSVKRIGELPAVVATVSASALEQLAEDPNVVAVTRERIMSAALTETRESTGATLHHAAGFEGKGWNVAVLDTGVDRDHPMLKGSIWAEACFSTNYADPQVTVESFCKGGESKAFGKNTGRNCDVEFSEGCEHGTHVAGIIAGRPGQIEDGKTISGIAPASKIVAVQVFSKLVSEEICSETKTGRCVRTLEADQIAALDWIYRKRDKLKLAAVNMSLGGGEYKEPCDSVSPAYTEILDKLREAGIAVVVATGNENLSEAIGSPACISSAISVAATKKDGTIDEEYSNVAPFVSIAAPGSEILSAVPGDGTLKYKWGTSMAAPHVAAAFAILRQEYPDKSVGDLLKILRKKGRTVKDGRTGTKLRRMDLARIEPAANDPGAFPAGAELDDDDKALQQGVVLTATSETSLSTFIVKSDMSEDEIRKRLDKDCGGAGCKVERIADGVYRLVIPAALLDELGQTKGAGGIDAQLQNMIGGDAIVTKNRATGISPPKLSDKVLKLKKPQ